MTPRSQQNLMRTRRHRYLHARAVISLIALGALIVPGIVAVLAAAVSAF
jgi:hypothetical protein